MLTVDYDRLGLRAGELVLDLGSGPGRHAFETIRRSARVVLCDYDTGELAQARTMVGAMGEAGEIDGPIDRVMATAQGDGVSLPFPDGTFDRIIAAEVLEHIPDDAAAMAEIARVLKPGGRVAVSVPRWLPERICWALSDQYHTNEGGHIRIYRGDDLRARLAAVGLEPGRGHHAHALHAPFWWLKCATGVERDTAAVRAYHRLLVWDLTKRPCLTRTAERVLDPVIGKSLVVYADKPPTGAAEEAVPATRRRPVATSGRPDRERAAAR